METIPMHVEYAVVKLTKVSGGRLVDSWYVELRLVDSYSVAREKVGQQYGTMAKACAAATYMARQDGARVMLPCLAC